MDVVDLDIAVAAIDFSTDDTVIGLLFPKMWWNQGLNLGPPAF